MSILRHFLFFCIVSSLVSVSQSQAQTQPHAAGGEAATPRAKIVSAAKVLIAKNRPAYLVSFSFDFDNSPSIYIKGFGVVSSKGTYQYISTEPELQFCDPTTGAVLERLPIEETTVVAAKPPLNEIPGDNEFSQGIHSYTWELPVSLQERANAVLAKYFIYSPHENNKLTYLATTYTPLPLNKKLADDGVLAELALLLSFPYDPASGKYSFHVQYSTKEGRALSDELRQTDNPEILQAANNFVDKIVAAMKAGK